MERDLARPIALDRFHSAETTAGVDRREFITLLGGAMAAWPLSARAQEGDRMRRIGVLLGVAERDLEAQARVLAFRQGLHDHGWTEGRNVRIDWRWAAAEPERMRTYAAELVALAPDVILANTTPVVAALLQATRTITIVFVQVVDPVGSGFVSSLARPGGNVTGFITFEFSMGGKWLQTLKQIAPRVKRVALVFNPDTAPFGRSFVKVVEDAAPSFAVEATALPVRADAEIERAVAAFATRPDGGLIVLPDIFNTSHRETIVALAARHGLPAVYPFRYYATSGGLVSDGVDEADLYRRSASYVDRIIKGGKAGELPVQAPTKFELVINLKTAKALGLDVAPGFSARADEVIE
jgi:putative tryptophan/tyrosine transport system substrate-binding protein